MSYEDSPVDHRRDGSQYGSYSRSKGFDDYDKSSRHALPPRRDGPRESNGYGPPRYSRGDDRSYGGRSAHQAPSRYATDSRDRSRAASPKPSRVLGVFGLSLKTEERHLYDVMSAYGALDDIQIVYDSLTGRSRGFAFVYFQNLEDARSARAACARGLELHDRVLRVDYSLTSAPHQPTPGVYMGKDKRRNYPDRGGRRFGYGDDRRGPRPMSSYRRSRSPPPRRRPEPDSSPYHHRRSRVVSSSRSRSPPPVYRPGSRVREDLVGRPRMGAERFVQEDQFGAAVPKVTREWSSRSGSSR